MNARELMFELLNQNNIDDEIVVHNLATGNTRPITRIWVDDNGQLSLHIFDSDVDGKED